VTCCEISCFLKTTAKKLGGPIRCWSPNLKVGDQSLPVPMVVVPMGLKAYVFGLSICKTRHIGGRHLLEHGRQNPWHLLEAGIYLRPSIYQKFSGTCTKTYKNRARFDIIIAEIKLCIFAPHVILFTYQKLTYDLYPLTLK